MLKHEYKETPTLDEALQLAIKVLNKTLDSTKLSSEKGLLVCLDRDAVAWNASDHKCYLFCVCSLAFFL